jgi:hypothetical protein
MRLPAYQKNQELFLYFKKISRQKIVIMLYILYLLIVKYIGS